MSPKYRYDADKGEAIPVETEQERLEREDRERREAAEEEWRREQERREERRVGAYL